MCKNASKTVAALMTGIEPTLVQLLTITGIASTPAGQTAIKAYDTALTAVQNWVPGTSGQDAVQVINAFTDVFNVLPLPTEVKGLADIIVAGVETVIGILTANAPAPAPTIPEAGAPATAEETQVMHQAAVIHATTVRVNTLVPGFKRSMFTAPDHQYKNAWNKEVEKVGGKYMALKQ